MNYLTSSFIPFALAIFTIASTASVPQQATSIADKIEPINSHESQMEQLRLQQQQQNSQNRSPFLDSLFNIPIQTLRAVNELVQGLSGSVQNFMASRPRPIRSLLPSRRRYDREHNDQYSSFYYFY